MDRIRAVLVGVDEYERSDIPPLRGCVNDVMLVRWLLRTCYGVPNEDIRVLVNQRATKRNIVARLDSALRQAEAGDVVVFYFSGHGSQIRDRDGDELTDALDELICPYDMDWDLRNYLIDDDLDIALNTLHPGAVLEAFFDCCFWGAGPPRFTLDRHVNLAAAVRYLPPPVDIYARMEGEEDRVQIHRLSRSQGFAGRNVLWAASEEGRPAAEDDVDGRTHGVFTFHGCHFIANNVDRPNSSKYSRLQLLDDLRACFDAQTYQQRPELAAPPELLVTRPFLSS